MRILSIIFCILAWGVGLASAQTPSKYAILVGVGQYDVASTFKVQGGNGDLRGDLNAPPNDVRLMREIISYYGFTGANTKSLINSEATRQKIVEAVEEQIRTLPPKSLLIFYFSGHGSQVEGRDSLGQWVVETILPYDARRVGEPPRDIYDSTISGWIAQLAARHVDAVFIFDSCKSGGMARTVITAEKSAPSINIGSSPRPAATSFRELSGAANSGVVVLTGSAAWENAEEFQYTAGEYRSWLTHWLYQSIVGARPTPPKTWQSAYQNILGKRRETPGITQNPKLYGESNTPLFQTGVPFSHSAHAKKIDDAAARLIGAGSDIGITEGSLFKLFGSSQIPWDASPEYMAMARVTKADRGESRLAVVDGRKLTETDIEAVEHEYALPDVKFAFAVNTNVGLNELERNDLKTALSQLPFVDWRPDVGSADIVLALSGSGLALMTRSGKIVGTAFVGGGSLDIADKIRHRLLEYARWQRIGAWKNQPRLPVRLGIAISIRTASGETAVRAGPPLVPTVPSGVDVKVVVENGDPRRLKIDAILLRPDYTISVCKIAPLDTGQRLDTSYVRLPAATGDAAWKLIIYDASQDVDLSILVDPPAAARAPGQSLTGALASMIWADAPSSRSVPTAGFYWETTDVRFAVSGSAAPNDGVPAVRECFTLPSK